MQEKAEVVALTSFGLVNPYLLYFEENLEHITKINEYGNEVRHQWISCGNSLQFL